VPRIRVKTLRLILRVGEVHIEERSFVARNAPLDDGQRRVDEGDRLRRLD
jgi:hypothetical protein